MLDVEEELAKFTVRSNKLPIADRPSTSRNYKTEIYLIPLLVKDIHKLTLPHRSFAETITAFGLPFSTALIYGRMSSNGACANGNRRYCLDDGTGTIQVRLQKCKALNNISKLDLQCFRAFGSNQELYNSVQNILKTTRRQLLEIGYIPYGTKVLLIGRPHKFFEDIIFTAFQLIVDTDVNNDLEISVKNFIIEWYTKRYKVN